MTGNTRKSRHDHCKADSMKEINTKESNYDINPIQLFRHLENRNWVKAIEICMNDPNQASTWVFRMEEDAKTLRWKMLGLHAAIIFQGSDEIIDALLEAYPNAAKMTDDQGMLPVSFLLSGKHLF